MNTQWVLGIDIGGSGVRCLLVDATSGDAFDSACGGWKFAAVPGTIAGFDVDLDTVWSHIGATCKEVLLKAGVSGDSVVSVAV